MTTRVEHVNVYSKTDRVIHGLGRHWISVVIILLGLYVIVPFLAPVFMAGGWTIPAKVIYLVYSFLCHQLPERSYFLFGPRISYSLPEIQSVWQNANNMLILRQFVGNAQMGWKVAWSDRMVSMFTSLWVFSMLWGIFKQKIKPLPWWGLFLLLLPLAVDGITHAISDLAGIGQGFRDTNTWLAALTNISLPAVFYAGDAWGSFNAWMRLISGVLFGLGIVWFGFPYIDEAFINSWQAVEYKYQYRALLKNEKEHQTKLPTTAVSRREVPGGGVQYEQEGKNDDRP